MATSRELQQIVRWYRGEARSLPWRGDHVTPWGVMVSEFMLQQTPVNRVLPVYEMWMRRWPTPGALAAATTGDALRAWGRLGYPRRALRLHAAATECLASHNGAVPADLEALRALPGVGDYTAGAIAAFAYGQRCAVLDTNVRRVHARWLDGDAFPRSSSPTVRERSRALELLPRGGAASAEASIAVMEFGAVVCTARGPACEGCPIASSCAWRVAGSPEWDGPPRRGQPYAGTDRQCRGALLAVLRDQPAPVPLTDLMAAWPIDAAQRMRALDGLVADGLVAPLDNNTYALPS